MPRFVIAGLLVIAGSTAPCRAQTNQTPSSLEPWVAMGQPSRWLPYASGFELSRNGRAGVGALVGVHHPVLNPVTGLLGASAELAGDWTGTDRTASARVVATVPALGVGVGADWRPSTGGVATIFTFQSAIRRGGIIGGGSMLRWDWLPSRHQFAIGIQLPVMQPFAGNTRAPRTAVRVADPPSIDARGASLTVGVTRALDSATSSASLLASYVSLYSPEDERTLAGTAVSYDAALRAYHSSIADAFRMAVGDTSAGTTAALHARAILLRDVVLPYDALFGQVKESGVFSALCDGARRELVRWIDDSLAVLPDAKARARAVATRWLDVIGGVYRSRLDQWNDSRLVWLPPQLALAPDEFDDQSEVDALIGRAVGHSFTDSNVVAYLRTADLPLEIARSIIAARKYHVLWTHDFTGRRPSGRLDQISYTLVADAYLPALTAAVQRYDSTGQFPEFTILLDAFYYHARFGRLWMSVLEDPLNASIRLRRGEDREASHIRERLDALRSAVAQSSRLRRDAAAHGGRAWLSRLVRVHVNIILPSDFSFRSNRIIPPLPFTPDNVGRDHRKLVFYDFTESDPYAGDLLVMGIGIGEHYASATWEDRGYRVRGPAALEARVELRRTLVANGLDAGKLPSVFRATTSDPPRAARDSPRDAGRVLQVHNEPGFGAKRASVARAMLYSLAPPGSVLIVPDPLWASASWAALLAGAAARGSSVVIIAPASANAPSPEPPVLVLERDMLHRLLGIRHRLGAQLGREGGALHIGLYAAHAPVTDPRARLAEVHAGLANAPWIRSLIPFGDATLAELDRATAQTAPAASDAMSLAHDEAPREPQLHQKTIFLARPGAIAALVRQPGWGRALAETMRAQARETARLADAITASEPQADTAAVRAADGLLQGYERSLGAADRTRFSFYSSAGSQNHDPRGLMLDGEATVIVSGFDASAGLVDLFYLMARTTWVDNDADIDRLVPPPGGLMDRIARIVRFVM